MDFSDVSWRDAILAAIVLLGVYLVFLLLRLAQAKQRGQRLAESGRRYQSDGGEELVSLSTRTAGRVAEYAASLEEAESERRLEPVVGLSFDAPAEGFRDEMLRLRDELETTRKEVARLQEEVGILQARNGTSPLYTEAMTMAVRGMDAAGIAGRCGISIAEAELVVALAKKPAQTSPAVAHDEGTNER